MSDEDSEETYTIEYVSFVVNTIAVVLNTILMVYHFRAYYQDFYTVERKSVAHRRNKPEITQTYKLVAWCTAGNIVCAMIFSLGILYSQVLTADKLSCRISLLIRGVSFFTGKVLTYAVFTLRLYIVYHGSKYGYSIGFLKACIIATGLYSYCFAMFFQIGTHLDIPFGEGFSLEYDGYSGHFVELCEAFYAPWYSGMYGLFDIGISTFFCILFIKPIFKVMKNVNPSQLGDVSKESKLTNKMLTVGLKVAILTGALFITTLIGVFVYTAVLLNIWGIDVFINALCLCFMTPYYVDSKFYHKFCCLCICLCDRKGYTKREVEAKEKEVDKDPSIYKSVTSTNSDVGGQPSDVATSTGSSAVSGGAVSSVDTMSAVRVGAQKPANASGEVNVERAKSQEKLLA